MDSRISGKDGILLRDVRWSVKTAGPSPDNNNRTELFLLGCDKAMKGYPCKGCFNSSTWDNTKAEFSYDPIKMAEHINKYAPNKYITIGGGEPLMQIDNLIILCKELKKYNFHIIVYTWRRIEYFTRSYRAMHPIYIPKGMYLELESDFCIQRDKGEELINTIDILIDGEYKENEKLYNFKAEDGLTNSIGSGNQGIIDCKNKMRKILMKEIKELKLDKDNNLIIDRREDSE